MKNLIFALFLFPIFASSQGTTLYSQFDSAIVSVSYSRGDSINFKVPNNSNQSIMIQPYQKRNTWFLDMVLDSLSGAAGTDTSRCTINLKYAPVGYDLTTGVTSVLINSLPLIQTWSLPAKNVGSNWPYFIHATGETGGGQYYIQVIGPAGVQNTRVRTNFEICNKKD